MEKISRRKFLNLSAAAASSLMIVPRHVLGGKKMWPLAISSTSPE